MGKVTRTYPQGHFRLYTRTKDKTKPLAVQLEYVVNSIPIRRATGITVYEKDWNPSENKHRGGIKASYGPDYANLNKRLIRLVEGNDAKIADFVENNAARSLTPQVIRDIIDKAPITRKDKGIDFVEFIKEFLEYERQRNIIGESSYVNGKSALKLFTEFLKLKRLGTYKPDAIYISEISVALIEKHIEWRLKERKNNISTIKHAITPILKGCTRASKDGLIPVALNDRLQEIKIIDTPDINEGNKSLKKCLTMKQLNSLIKYYKEDTNIHRSECTEIFLFAMYAGGLRFIDIVTLQWDNINFKTKTLNKIQVKTKNRCIVPLGEQALNILKQWKEKNRNNRFVFGLLPEDIDLNDGELLYKHKGSLLRNINYSLHVIGNSIGLPFELTFHVARHTFAVTSLNQGMTLSMVSQLMGHSSTAMTEKVYAHYLTSTMESEIKKLNLPFL